MSETSKRPGSRRYKKATRFGIALPGWHEETPPGREEVGIDFVCERKGHKSEVVGKFRMYTYDGAERRVGFDRPSDGGSPEESGRPQGQAKALLICPRCGHEKQITEARLKEALDALWEPHGRRVVVYRI